LKNENASPTQAYQANDEEVVFPEDGDVKAPGGSYVPLEPFLNFNKEKPIVIRDRGSIMNRLQNI
jgi:hypothetical protein